MEFTKYLPVIICASIQGQWKTGWQRGTRDDLQCKASWEQSHNFPRLDQHKCMWMKCFLLRLLMTITIYTHVRVWQAEQGFIQHSGGLRCVLRVLFYGFMNLKWVCTTGDQHFAATLVRCCSSLGKKGQTYHSGAQL